MTLPDLPTFRDGVVSTAADLNALTANITNLYAVAMGGKTLRKPSCVLRVTGTIAMATGTDVLITWGVADVDNDLMWSSGTPTVVTINTAGVWKIDLIAGTNGAYNDGLSTHLLVNGTNASTNGVGFNKDFKSFRNRATATLALAAGAQVTGTTGQSSGVSRNLATGTAGCRFEFVYVGPT